MKDGLILENGELTYYKNGVPFQAGVIETDGYIYYIGEGGKAVKGRCAIHREYSNGILEHGTYIFGDDYRLIPNSRVVTKSHRFRRYFLSERKKEIAILMAVTVFFIGVVIMSQILDKDESDTVTYESNISITHADITLPVFSTEVLLFSEEAKLFYNDEISYEDAVMSGNPYRPLDFRYLIRNSEDGKLFLSENENFADCKEIILPHNDSVVTIDNLKTGTSYYYKVEHSGKTYEGEFKTAQGVRFIYYSGMTNARDIGGYETIDGKKIKQGLLIRGGEIDGLAESSYIMDKEYTQKAKTELGLVYDMDLRNSGVFIGKYTSRFGADVRHDFFDSPQYGLIFNSSYKDSIKKMFSALADENNYPMYFHCTHGVDRTGSIVFLLQGVLGVPENKMISEYLNSGFASKRYVERKNIDAVIASLEFYNGESINEKIENFLVNDVGVTSEEINSIRNILLEG